MSYEKELSVLSEVTDHFKSVRNRLALRIDARAVQETPKDTTEAASAWLVSDGRPNDSESNVRNTGAAIAQGASEIGRAKPYTELFIQNVKPYIEALNEGSSLQAPAKYIDRIIEQEVNREQ